MKKEFQILNDMAATKMAKDKNINKVATKIFVEADKKYRWLHQNTWMDEPILNIPQDIMATQEIIYKSRPEYIIETGVAWGGSTLFLASMLKIFGGKKGKRARVILENMLFLVFSRPLSRLCLSSDLFCLLKNENIPILNY